MNVVRCTFSREKLESKELRYILFSLFILNLQPLVEIKFDAIGLKKAWDGPSSVWIREKLFAPFFGLRYEQGSGLLAPVLPTANSTHYAFAGVYGINNRGRSQTDRHFVSKRKSWRFSSYGTPANQGSGPNLWIDFSMENTSELGSLYVSYKLGWVMS